MKSRVVWQRLCVAVSVLVGLLLVAPSASATTDAARLAAAGIDASVLAPGWSIVGDEIWWEDGQVRRSIGDTELECRAGYVCAYEHQDLGGSWFTAAATNKYYYLVNYGWNDRASSWINRTSSDARWWYHESGSPNPYRCMNAGSSQEHMSAADNDQMSTLVMYTSATVC